MNKKIIRQYRDKIPVIKNRKGFGTVEIVLITAVLIALAMMFRTAIIAYAGNLLDSVFKDTGSISTSVSSGEILNE